MYFCNCSPLEKGCGLLGQQQRRRTTAKFQSEKLTWAFSSCELKTIFKRNNDHIIIYKYWYMYAEFKTHDAMPKNLRTLFWSVHIAVFSIYMYIVLSPFLISVFLLFFHSFFLFLHLSMVLTLDLGHKLPLTYNHHQSYWSRSTSQRSISVSVKVSAAVG